MYPCNASLSSSGVTYPDAKLLVIESTMPLTSAEVVNADKSSSFAYPTRLLSTMA